MFKKIFIPSSDFMRNALDYIGHIENQVIHIGDSRLAKLMIEHNVGVTPVVSYEIKKIDSGYFTEDRG